ncbi:hypothetical protein SAMN05892883_1588 [Jatrophihabitans sp. GAS493]|uniref:hypothetical protein n=1 Tax=Jatrophihabitans sp. GAS493 TaxID=1907575 RepID=UPI000BB99E88|nr:hypothetical protein [Jatrophihabitans sp. GAS493]SOD72164.1 hypothetical protein SAMN05892883_1588 [Jatrophihabitans sp. GAS493]
MLVPLDDYFIHQSSDSIAVPGGGSTKWQERNYFNVHSADGEALLVCGMGTTPNTDLASVYVIAHTTGPDGGQTDWRGVRPIAGERTRMDVGEFAFEIVEPMKQWRITLAPNPSGIEIDLLWTARHQPFEFEKVFVQDDNGDVSLDFAHLHQSGTHRGWFKIDGKKYEVDDWYGVRDRTWGIREALEFWIWSCVHFPSRTLSLYHFESPDGKTLYSNGGFADADSTGPSLRILSHDFELVPGERVPRSGSVVLETESGEKLTMDFKPIGPIVNYFAPKPVDLAHPYASALGRPENGWERWSNAEYAEDARTYGYLHDALCEFRIGDEVGYGVWELIALDYQPYGWTTPFKFSASVEAGKYERE